MTLTKIAFFKWRFTYRTNKKRLFRSFKFTVLLVFVLFINKQSGFSQFIIHVQDWEGVAGSGNWLRIENETLPHNFTRGNDVSAVANGNRASYISTDDINYGYDETADTEVYAYKEVTFPATGNFFLKFDWKCVGEASGGIAYDYARLFIVPTGTGLTEADLTNEATSGDGFEIDGPGTQGRFVEEPSFVTMNHEFSAVENGLVQGNDYMIVFLWTNDDNTTNGDPFAVDNIIISDGDATQPLSGTYQIGKNSAGSQRFDSLMHATALLNMNGVSGNINFELTDEDYSIKTGDLPLRIENFNTNPKSTVSNAELLLQPIQNASLTPTINGVNGSNSVLLIDRANNITINGDNGGTASNDLSIANNGTTNPIGIHIGSDIATSSLAENIEIHKTNINLNSTTGTGLLISDFNSIAAGIYDNISIIDNSFSGGARGVYALANDGNTNGSNLSILNNLLDDNLNPIGQTAIEINGTENVIITSNKIGNISSNGTGNIKGIHLGANTADVLINKNEIYNLSHSNQYGVNAVYLATEIPNAAVLIKNNMVYNISADGWDYTSTFFDNAIGFAIEGNQSGISILNNSIYLKEGGSNILTANQDSYTACMSIGTGSTVNTLKNNIFINALGGDNSGAQPAGYTTIAYQGTFTDHFPDIDYNLYYSQVGSPAGGTESLASNFSSSASSLENFKTLSGSDFSSIGASSGDMATFNGAGFNFDPERLFTAVSEGAGNYLSIDESQQESWLINAGGTHLVDVTEDFAGVSRNTDIAFIPPSLGAFEFTPNTQPVPAYQDGAITDAGISNFYVGNRKILSLTWDANGGNLPTVIDVNYFPGSLPPDSDGYPVFNSYVQINATDGSGFEYDLELAYEPSLLAGISTNDILLTKRSDGVNDWSTWPTAVNTGDRIFSVANIDNGFSYFTGTDQTDPLPVELISFTASLQLGEIQLQWETASEKNSDYFIVEKSDQKQEWKNIKTVNGAGNSNSLIKYSISDLNPFYGIQYYRLKQVDIDGEFEYSSILRVDYAAKNAAVFPNPFRDKIFVNINGEQFVRRFELMNITGNAITISPNQVDKNKWAFNTHSLEIGTYILYIYLENKVLVRKLIKR